MPKKPNQPLATIRGVPIRRNPARVAFAEEMLRDHNYPTTRTMIMQQFGVHKATAERDIAEAKRLIASLSEREIPVLRAYETRRLERIADKAEGVGDFKAAVAASREIGRLNGTYAPKQIEVKSTSVNVAIQVDAIVGILDEAGLAALDLINAQIERAKEEGRLALPAGEDADDDEADDADPPAPVN